MTGVPSAPLGGVVRDVGLPGPGERRALDLVPAEDAPPGRPAGRGPSPRCASGSAGPPGSCRRASRPGRSRAGTQTCSRIRAVSSPRTLRVPSLKPIRLRGVDWVLVVAEVRPKPSCDQRITHGAAADAGQVADGVEGDLRVVGAGLDAEVAAGAAGVEAVAGQGGRSAAAAPGRRAARPNRSSNSDGPKPTVIGQVAPAPARPPRRCRPAAPRAGSVARARAGRGSSRPRRRSTPAAASAQLAPRSVVTTSKRRTPAGPAPAVAMPAWCSPWKATVPAARPAPRPATGPATCGRRRPATAAPTPPTPSRRAAPAARLPHPP